MHLDTGDRTHIDGGDRREIRAEWSDLSRSVQAGGVDLPGDGP